MTSYWLIKSEPDVWSWEQQTKVKFEPWSGVRNHQAAQNLRAMKKGDLCFFYHSNIGKEIVGIAEVVKEHYIDPTDENGKFPAVNVKAVEPLKKPVTLATIKATPSLSGMALLKQSRLSVSAVSAAEWKIITKMGGL